MISKSADETKKIAENFLRNILADGPRKIATVVALSGDLGSGKTTFAQAAAAELGIKENISSPTFVIEKIYKIPHSTAFTHLIHIDAYRIEDEKELGAIGFAETLKDPRNIVFIEWPEKILKSMPQSYTQVSLFHKDEEKREIRFNSVAHA